MSWARRHSAWMWLAALLASAGILSVLAASPDRSSLPLDLDSARPNGGLALKLWLGGMGYSVSRHASFTTPAQEGTLLLLEPLREPTRTEVEGLRGWTSAGGRLVIATSGQGGLLRDLGFPAVFAPSAPVRTEQPLLLAPPAARLVGSTSLVGDSLRSPAVAATRYGAVAARLPLGRGHVWVLTAPTLLDNALIGRAQNRRLLLNLVGPPGAIDVDQPRPASVSGGATDWLTGTAAGIAVLFGLAVALLYRWLGGWRLGPPIVPFSERRRPAVEYVLSLAALLRRAQQRADVLAIYQRELREHLRRRFGSDAPDDLPPAVRDAVTPLLLPVHDLSEDDLIERAAAIVRCEEALKEHV